MSGRLGNRPASVLGALALCVSCFACEGVIVEGRSAGAGAAGEARGSRAGAGAGHEPGATDGQGEGQGGAGSDSSAGGAGGAGAEITPPACLDAVFRSSSAPLRRLTAAEYRNTVSALFPGASVSDVEIVADGRQDGFTNSAAGQPASALAVERYQAAAQSVATAAVAARTGWAPCSDDTLPCALEVARTLGMRAYRRPLDAEETDMLEAFMRDAHAQHGAVEAHQMLIEALLQSPYFLYRPEFGSGQRVGEGAVALSGYEMASRLSYFFVASMPDDELFAAAERGELGDDAGIRAQAERLIADPRARPVLSDFFAQWLRLYKLDELSLDPGAFPQFDQGLRADLQESARLYIDKALWEDDSWRVLLTGSYGYVNDRLAPIFGVPAPGSDALVYTELDPMQRRGVLSQPALLASTSHGVRHSPIFRGVTLLTSFLCSPPPAPPPGAATAEPIPVDASEVCTTRDEVQKTHTEGNGCQGCHTAIDGAGFVFEHYDALGRYRSEENECAIDASGVFPGTDIEGEVEGAAELASRMVHSADVTACASEHLFRFALGRPASREDECEIAALAARLRGDGDSLQALVLDLVLTPSFRSRPEVP